MSIFRAIICAPVTCFYFSDISLRFETENASKATGVENVGKISHLLIPPVNIRGVIDEVSE